MDKIENQGFPKIYHIGTECPHESGHYVVLYKRNYANPIIGLYLTSLGFRIVEKSRTVPIPIDYEYWSYTGSTIGVPVGY
jgi:hypothetical protein